MSHVNNYTDGLKGSMHVLGDCCVVYKCVELCCVYLLVCC